MRGATVVAVAQLVESRIVIPVVVGSNPISHPIHLKEDFVLFIFTGHSSEYCVSGFVPGSFPHWSDETSASLLRKSRISFPGVDSDCAAIELRQRRPALRRDRPLQRTRA